MYRVGRFRDMPWQGKSVDVEQCLFYVRYDLDEKRDHKEKDKQEIRC